MITRNPDGTIAVKGASYDLLVRGHIVDVIICGTAFASLDVRTAVNKTSDDLTPITDEESTIPTLASVEEKPGEAVFTWTGKSSLWEKEYKMVCTYTRFRYYVTVKGQGRVDSVNYFAGNMTEPGFGSGYEFSEGFYPCKPYPKEDDYYFRASVRCYRQSVFMVPPMFCYAFRCEGVGDRLALGLVAERGEHNFHSFDYNLSRLHNLKSGFYLTTDQDGHTVVDGEWTAPCIIGYSATDEFNAMQKYSDYYFSAGIAKPVKKQIVPRFWHGPIVCGWIEQGSYAFKSNPRRYYRDFCTEEVYNNILAKLKENDLRPAAMIIDDKWMTEYATDVIDTEKWPDFRGFVDARHVEGIHTMLWFMMWDSEGWDESICVTADNGDVKLDPSHPRFVAHLDAVLERIFSDAEGCYDIDGLKLDYGFTNPKGRGVNTYSGKYGVELMYDMMAQIYRRAKEVKPHAVINNSACHPYFAHICDQARLHDYEPQDRFNLEDLSMRGKMFAIAMPGILQDTDNSAFVSRRDTMRWQLNQQIVGIPDLYAVSPNGHMDINSDDLRAIAEVWNEYSAKIDAMYNEE
ncbi:MAG: hypothetical protein E7638_04235 [Ruminococcaceae bacterium]|nr:hypothetical protein [Oscillospiraceae bacterium]